MQVKDDRSPHVDSWRDAGDCGSRSGIVARMSALPTRILFVCLGNICRSPTAEAAFRHLVALRGRTAAFHLDSAGTSGEHDGELPHAGTRATAAARGMVLTHRSRRVRPSDFAAFDWLVAMDRRNERDLLTISPSPEARAKVLLFRRFEIDADSLDVPDPWYTGEFDGVFEICTRASEGLLDTLEQNRVQSSRI